MNVVSFVSYCSPEFATKDSRRAISLMRAIKRLKAANQSPACRLNKCADIRDVQQGLGWFGYLAALVVESQAPSPPVILIPIPNNDCLYGLTQRPRTIWLAEAISKRLKVRAIVADTLRWNRQRTASHRGGTRDVKELCKGLVLTSVPPDGSVVLVDDVVTTGGHLLAAAATLAMAGVRCNHAICLARTEYRADLVFGIQQTLL